MWPRFPAELSPFHPFYHTVSGEPLPHIQHLYAIKSIAAFEAELDFLLQNFEPIIPGQSAYHNCRKPPMLLSFDDGLRECHQFIAPILERKGIPAIFFVNSAFVDNKALFYRFKVSLLIDYLQNANIIPAAFHKWGSDKTQIKQALHNITHEKSPQLDDSAKELGVDFEAFLHNQQPYMTLSELHDLSRRGFVIGAHSHSHPHFYPLTAEKRKNEIAKSIRFIREHFPSQPVYFSFPFTDYGLGNDFLKSLSYEFGIQQSFGCAGLKKESIATHSQRFAMEMGTNSVTLRLQVAIMAYRLKKILGKHLINRSVWT
jgi:peptidoglycan/xylan/chitin deacetylase (PgdA/CDA1 family)